MSTRTLTIGSSLAQPATHYPASAWGHVVRLSAFPLRDLLGSVRCRSALLDVPVGDERGIQHALDVAAVRAGHVKLPGRDIGQELPHPTMEGGVGAGARRIVWCCEEGLPK